MFSSQPDTSILIYRDICAAMSDWHESQSDERSSLLMRELLFLQAMLPVVIFIEQAGHSVPAADLLDLNLVDRLLSSSSDTLGAKFDLVSAQLHRCLAIIPAYRLSARGNQQSSSCDYYRNATAMMRNLKAAA